MKEEKQKSASEIIEDAKKEICDDYCKYAGKYDGENLPKECDRCSLHRL